jgi:transposase
MRRQTPPAAASAPPRAGVAWTAAEDHYLRTHYSTHTIKEMGRELGRSEQQVRTRINRLIAEGALTRRQRAYRPPWTEEEEEELLGQLWGMMPDRAVARRLGRTVKACERRAQRNGLARRHQFYTARAVADLFGVEHHTVLAWLAVGWLRGRPSVVGAGPRRAWRIDDADLEAFVKDCGWAYDRRRIEAGTYWRNLADRVWARDPWLPTPAVAAALGVSVWTVRDWLAAGRMAGKKRFSPTGGRPRWMVRRSEVARVAAERTAGRGRPPARAG